MTLNPIRFIRRRRRLRRAIDEEVYYLRHLHGEGAHAAALAKLKRPDLTSWGRRIVQGAARQTMVPARHASTKHHRRHAHASTEIFNPIKLIRRRQRLRKAIEEEVYYLRRTHGKGAHAAALEKLRRSDLTHWGRQIVEGAVRQTLVAKSARRVPHRAHHAPIIVDPIALLSRRSRLRRAIMEEVAYLRRMHGQAARTVAVQKLERADLTHWGRQIVLGAAREILS